MTLGGTKMCRRSLLVAMALMLGGQLAPAPADEPVKDSAVSAMQDNQFTIDLYRRLAASRERKNVVFSPRSIESALAVLLAGARGTTGDEIARVMHAPDRAGSGGSENAARWGRLDRVGENYEVVSATHLWGARNVRFSEAFLTRVSKDYGADLSTVDFSQGSAVLKEINDWVKGQTRGKIETLLSRPPDPAATKLVVANAVYFKAGWGWEGGFPKKDTADAPFFTAAGPTAGHVKLMYAKLTTGYVESDAVQIVQLPYAGGEFAAVVLLPRWRQSEGTGVLGRRMESLERSLTAESLDGWLTKARPTGVLVALPRFELSESLDLRAPLIEMGMRAAFGPEADFSGMATGPLQVTDVVHRAIVEVNEEGTVAGAATGVVVGAGATPFVRADHPFLFLIRDVRTGTILFMARVDDPPRSSKT